MEYGRTSGTQQEDRYRWGAFIHGVPFHRWIQRAMPADVLLMLHDADVPALALR